MLPPKYFLLRSFVCSVGVIGTSYFSFAPGPTPLIFRRLHRCAGENEGEWDRTSARVRHEVELDRTKEQSHHQSSSQSVVPIPSGVRGTGIWSDHDRHTRMNMPLALPSRLTPNTNEAVHPCPKRGSVQWLMIFHLIFHWQLDQAMKGCALSFTSDVYTRPPPSSVPVRAPPPEDAFLVLASDLLIFLGNRSF